MPQRPDATLLIQPPSSFTRRTVTFGAPIYRLAPFVKRMSCTTAPGVVTVRLVLRVCAGVQPAGTPVVDGFGKSAGDGAGAGAGAAPEREPWVAADGSCVYADSCRVWISARSLKPSPSVSRLRGLV